MELEYHELYKSESCGSYGGFGVQILVAATKLKNFGTERLRMLGYRVEEDIKNTMLMEVASVDPEYQAEAKAERESLLGCFNETIYV